LARGRRRRPGASVGLRTLRGQPARRPRAARVRLMASRGASNRRGRHLGLAAALIAPDQFTKWIAVRLLGFGERVPVIPGFFDFTLVYNRGAAFSFLAGAGGWQRWFFTGIGIAAAVFIVWMLARHGSQRLFAFALSLILA